MLKDYSIGSRAVSFKRPLLSVDVSMLRARICVCNGVLCVGNFDTKYLGN